MDGSPWIRQCMGDKESWGEQIWKQSVNYNMLMASRDLKGRTWVNSHVSTLIKEAQVMSQEQAQGTVCLKVRLADMPAPV